MEFDQNEQEVHVCVGRKEGDSFIYECPICDYKVVFKDKNDGTATMKRTGGDFYTRHMGSYRSPLSLDISEN